MSGKEKADEKMNSGKTRALDEQLLGIFEKSYVKRYDRWKRRDLLSVAFQTFPKQVKKDNVVKNLSDLKTEFDKKLSDEG